MDFYTRYSGTVMLPSRRALAALRCLAVSWIAIRGVFLYISGGPGTEFENQLFPRSLEVRGVEPQRGPPQAREAVGAVDRLSRSVKASALRLAEDAPEGVNFVATLASATIAKNVQYSFDCIVGAKETWRPQSWTQWSAKRPRF